MRSLRNSLRIFERIAEGQHGHMLDLGSSNTGHFMVGAHWFDYVNLIFMHTFLRWTDATVYSPRTAWIY